MAIIGYIINLISFAGAVLLIKPTQDFITPYLATLTWAIIPAAYLVAWVLATFVFPRILISIYGAMNQG